MASIAHGVGSVALLDLGADFVGVGVVEDSQRLLPGVAGGLEVVGGVVGVAKAVPDVGLPAPVAELLVQGGSR